MKRDYYESPKAGIIMKLLWKAAGADEYVLSRGTYSDQVKYACLGGIVVATGFMAALAGGYAFYTIFEPKGDANEVGTDIATAMKSVVFGLIWGLIIFNIDRFIVAATGKGDGTEKITASEFSNAIPRIIMGLVIAITISKPMEIRMFKSEIDVKLKEKQIEQRTTYIAKIDANYKPLIKEREKEINVFEDKINTIEATILDLQNRINYEIQNGGCKGKCEENKRQQKKWENKLDEIKINPDLLFNRKELKGIYDRRAKEYSMADSSSNGLDGLLERIKLAHEVAGFWISFFITLLFVVIELTPIFFKMMLIKSPYDYLNDNIKDLMKAENGIQIKYDYYKDKEGQERNLTINHQAKRKIDEQMALIKAQTELSDYVIEKWKNGEKKKADKNLDNYISED
jgi:hypothetical protein